MIGLSRGWRAYLCCSVSEPQSSEAYSRPTLIFAKPQVTGPHQGDIQTAVSNAIQRVEQHKQSPDKSWKQFLKDVKAVA